MPAAQRQRMAAILETGEVVDELSVLSQGSFDQHPPALDVSGAFCESDLCYTYPEYLTHLRETERFAACHPNYTLKRTAAQAFRNLQIFLRVGQWAMVSKGKAPASTLSSAIPGCGRRWSGSSRRWWSDVCCKTKNKRSQVGTLVCFCVLPYQHHSRYYDATAAV